MIDDIKALLEIVMLFDHASEREEKASHTRAGQSLFRTYLRSCECAQMGRQIMWELKSSSERARIGKQTSTNLGEKVREQYMNVGRLHNEVMDVLDAGRDRRAGVLALKDPALPSHLRALTDRKMGVLRALTFCLKGGHVPLGSSDIAGVAAAIRNLQGFDDRNDRKSAIAKIRSPWRATVELKDSYDGKDDFGVIDVLVQDASTRLTELDAVNERLREVLSGWPMEDLLRGMKSPHSAGW